MFKLFLTLLLIVITSSCIMKDKDHGVVVCDNCALLKELSDAEYPDNPDISIRHKKYVKTEMSQISFVPNYGKFTITITPTKEKDDTVIMTNISLNEFIPTIPTSVKQDEYLSLLAIVNQEWNRNQVKWTGLDLRAVTPREFTVNGEKITRIDIARNCLNSYLWEVFFYAQEDGIDKVFYHGWFNFPKALYSDLFEQRNKLPFDKYAKHLESWVNPSSKEIDFSLIRKGIDTIETLKFKDLSNALYPLKGERKKKKKAIIYPANTARMTDFQTDSSTFATFSQPGYYNRKEPRKTQLGRFFRLENVGSKQTLSKNGGKCDELIFSFKGKNGEQTYFVFGGLNFADLPRLKTSDANSGKQYPMGIGNHPFYEDARSHDGLNSRENPYFALLMDNSGKWLDSHTIGIDGPLLHLDIKNPKLLHVWLLSFERHALVGHYTILLKN